MKNTLILNILALMSLSACTTAVDHQIQADYKKTEERMARLVTAQTIATTSAANTATTKVNSPYLGAKSIPLKTDLVLPEAFRLLKEFRFPNEKFNLSQAAERVSRISSIPVRISTDVSITAAAGAPAARTGTVATDQQQITLDATATPAGMLDQICTLLGLNWEYRDGVVVIQRYVTRTFVLKTPPGDSTFNFNSGKTGSSSAANVTGAGGSSTGTISSGFTSTAAITTKGTMDAMKSVGEAVKAALSANGKVVTSSASGTIMVIDTVEGVDRAAKIIERENEILTRRASFHVEVVAFESATSDESGIDWNAIFQNFGKLGATFTSPTSLVSSAASTLSMKVLSSGTNGRFDGSQAFIRMLSDYGVVSTVHSTDVMTRNRTVTPVTIPTQTAYLAKTTPAPASVGGAAGGTPGLEAGVVTTGFNLMLQPNVMDSNQISLQFAVGILDLIDIKRISSGTGINEQSIEVPQTSGLEFKQDVFLKNGQTVILSGYERSVSRFDRRSMGQDTSAMLGGSTKGRKATQKIFILITPTVVGNAY